MESNLYRVSYIYRNNPYSAVQEKVEYVVAETDVEAVDHVHSLHEGNEVTTASVARANVSIAGQPVYADPPERRHSAKDTRTDKIERRVGAPDTREGPVIPAVKKPFGKPGASMVK